MKTAPRNKARRSGVTGYFAVLQGAVQKFYRTGESSIAAVKNFLTGQGTNPTDAKPGGAARSSATAGRLTRTPASKLAQEASKVTAQLKEGAAAAIEDAKTEVAGVAAEAKAAVEEAVIAVSSAAKSVKTRGVKSAAKLGKRVRGTPMTVRKAAKRAVASAVKTPKAAKAVASPKSQPSKSKAAKLAATTVPDLTVVGTAIATPAPPKRATPAQGRTVRKSATVTPKVARPRTAAKAKLDSGATALKVRHTAIKKAAAPGSAGKRSVRLAIKSSKQPATGKLGSKRASKHR